MENLMKVCNKCNVDKSIVNFNKHPKTKDKLVGCCRLCNKEYKENYKKNNPEKVIEYDKRYREKNKKKVKEKNVNWQKNNPEKVRNIQKRYRINNPEKVRNNQKLYEINNKEKIKIRKSKWLETHKEFEKQRVSKYAINLTDNYIRSILKKLKLPITPEIIKIKRLTIKIHRLCKTKLLS